MKKLRRSSIASNQEDSLSEGEKERRRNREKEKDKEKMREGKKEEGIVY